MCTLDTPPVGPQIATIDVIKLTIQEKIEKEKEIIADMEIQVNNTEVLKRDMDKMVVENPTEGCSLTYYREIGYEAFRKEELKTVNFPVAKGLAGELQIEARLDSELGINMVNFKSRDEEEFKLCGYEQQKITLTHVTAKLNLYYPFYFKSRDENIQGEKYLDWLIYNVNFSAMVIKMFTALKQRENYVMRRLNISLDDAFYVKRTLESFEYLVRLVKRNRYL